MDIQALVLTLRLALATTALLLLVALPLAWWLVFGRAPSASSTFRPLVHAVVALPLVLPPTVLGFYLLVALGPATELGRFITSLLGHPLAFSFGGLVAGSVLYSLPFAVQPLVAGFSAVDPACIETAATLGASPLRVFRTIILPLSRSSLLASVVLTFTHTVGEFGVVLMIGGNIPGVTRTLSIALYDQVQDFNYAQANRTALLLVAISFLALVLIYARVRSSKEGSLV